MILSFRDKRTELFANGGFVRAFQGFDRQGWKRLEVLNAPRTLADLAGLPSNRLEALRGDRAGQYSIRINQHGGSVSNGRNPQRAPQTSRSSTITDRSETMPRPAIHPGEILADELNELHISPTELSRQLSVPPNRISQIIQGKRAITGDTALRLGHWFQTSPQFWLNLQSAYDLRVASEEVGREVAALPTKSAKRRAGA
jgi:antitoxin HigA-1